MHKVISKKISLFSIMMTVFFLFNVILPNKVWGDEPEPQNGIPLVIIRVDESETTIEDMNRSYDHSVRCNNATVEIKVPEGFVSEYDNENINTAKSTTGEIKLDYVRGRGNTTWHINKKPYKIQLNKAHDFFNMGASKDWALLANSLDKTLIKNHIIFWLGREMGLEFTPSEIPVDLVMIGSITGVHNYGSYFLCETIKVEESRINIDKLKKNDMENITGGYLVAPYTSQDDDKPESTKFTTNYGLNLLSDTPEFDDSEGELTPARIAQRDYIRNFVQKLEDLIMASGEIDESRHQEIAKILDFNSVANYWLLQEIPFNPDGFVTSSTYFYKKRDGKVFFGPLWDFDFAWTWIESKRTFNNTIFAWTDSLRDKDAIFVNLLKERLTLLNEKLIELTRPGGIIDGYKAQLSASVQADYDIWKNDPAGPGEYHGIEDYDAEITALKEWIEGRRLWAIDNINNIGKVFYDVTYEVDGEVFTKERVRYGEVATLDPDLVAPSGFVFKSWNNKTTGRPLDKVAIKKDETFVPEFVEESQAIAPEELYIDYVEESTNVKKEFFSLKDIAMVLPFDTTNSRITWTSSNENVGVIDPLNHWVVLKKAGDITITGTLYNDVSSSFVLHVEENIDDMVVELSSDTFTYNGNVQKPTINSIGGMQLVEGVDYLVAFSDASSKNVGNYIVTITGMGNYLGTTSATYKIVPANINVPSGNTLTYNGSLQIGVNENENYTASGNTGINVGTYQALLSLKDKTNFKWNDDTTNDKQVAWKIVKAKNTLNIKAKTASVRYNKVRQRKQVLAITKVINFLDKGQGALTYSKSSGNKKITINKQTGKVLVKKGLQKGVYKIKVKVSAAGNDNYNASEVKEVTFKVKVI